MAVQKERSNLRQWWAVTLLLFLPLAFFWQAALRQGTFYFGDIFRLYYPQRAVYAQALRQGRLPLWSPDILSGYPLLAEGEMGAFYPLNLLLYGLLPMDIALNYSIILHFMIAGLAMYLFARSLGLGPFGGLMAGLTYAFSGFFIGHVDHLSIMAAAPWLPLAFTLAKKEDGRWKMEDGKWKMEDGKWKMEEPPPSIFQFPLSILLCGLVLGMQLLAGHPQISLMTILALLAYALFQTLTRPANWREWRPFFLARTLPLLGAVALGLGLAAVQLLPTYELTQLSQRAGGLAPEFFTSFSWHPALLATLIHPFILGNPYPNLSVELAAYLGLLPLLLALIAPFLEHSHPVQEDLEQNRPSSNARTPSKKIWNRAGHSTGCERSTNGVRAFDLCRDRTTAFFGGLALLSLFLAFGHWNPFYHLLLRVPIFNLFRVPARFLYLFTFASAALAGMSADALASRLPHSARSPMLPVVCGLLSLLAFGLINAAPAAETLLAAWHVLPAAFLIGGMLLLIGAWRGRLERHLFMALAVGLTVTDLYAYSAVYGHTYNDTMPLSQFYARPRSLDVFAADQELYRVYTHEAIVPAMSVMRESLYPNIALLHGVDSANGYFPLIPRREAETLADLTPQRLNLLNVRYVLIPQLLPVDEETEFYDLENPFAPSLVGRAVTVPPTSALSIEIESYTSHSADWAQGELVAEIVLTGQGGERVTVPLRVGVETAEWAYDRPDVRSEIAHQRPPIARTWPARSGFPPGEHPGHSYHARFDLPSELTVSGLEIRPYCPRAFLRVDRVELLGEGGQRHLLAHLLGYGDHSLVYRSEDVAIYRNHDALPRAFVVHRARVVAGDEKALAALDAASFSPREEAILSSGEGLTIEPGDPDQVQVVSYEPERVVIEAELASEGYLILLDSYDPGWRALVDGVEAEIHRANTLFRAVHLSAGQHTIVFAYDPLSFNVGAAISLITAIGLGMGVAWWRRNRPWTGGGNVVYNRGRRFSA